MPPRDYKSNNALVNGVFDIARGIGISPVNNPMAKPQNEGLVPGTALKQITPFEWNPKSDWWSSAYDNSLLGQFTNSDDPSRRLNAGVGMGLSATQGITGLVNGFNSLSAIGDTTQQQEMIDDLRAVGTRDYDSFGSLAEAYNTLDNQLNIDYDDIRGMNTGQKLGNVVSTIGTGASAGMAFGPVGAVVGGLAGLGTGIVGWLNGDAKAADEQARLQREAKQATENATLNLSAANERLQDKQFRSGIVTRAAQGGEIERKQLTVKEFADKVLKTRKANDVTRSAGIVRRKGEGGTIIRIKM